MAGKSRKFPGDIHGDFSCRFMSRLSHLPERWIAFIVRHRIVKQRLDDELTALDDSRHRHRFLHRRPRAWRDANAVIANLIHPLVYAPTEPTCRKMRSMICASLMSDTMRIS